MHKLHLLSLALTGLLLFLLFTCWTRKTASDLSRKGEPVIRISLIKDVEHFAGVAPELVTGFITDRNCEELVLFDLPSDTLLGNLNNIYRQGGICWNNRSVAL